MINSGREWDWMEEIAAEDSEVNSSVHLSNRTCNDLP
jgi:hypothetical protein